MSSMPIVITGAHGQLGSELCRQLGVGAVGVDLPEFDLSEAATVKSRLRQLHPRVVVNTGAYTQVDRAENDADRCRAVNATAVTTLAHACADLDCPLIQLSTDYVFCGVHDRAVP